MFRDKGTQVCCRMCCHVTICAGKRTLAQTNWLVLLVLWICLSVVNANCKFPKYLQVDNIWTATYQNKDTFQGYFKESKTGSFLKATKCKTDEVTTCTEYRRICLSKVTANKYEVQHVANDNNEPYLYLCMEFIRRANNIIQIKESHGKAIRDASSCDDHNLHLNNWLYVTAEGFYKAKIPCPFSGGYNIRLHTSERRPKCPRQLIPPRLESECEPDDGISIDFRNPECKDDELDMDIQQSLHCAATWTHGQYTFIIVRPQEEEIKAWCLRITGTDRNQPILQGILFMELVCDPGGKDGDIRETSKYLMLEFEQHIVSSVCADQSNLCDERRMCNNQDYRPHCPKTCESCQGDQSRCPFPEGLRGKWVEKRGQEKTFVNIETYNFLVSDAGSFWCYEKEMHDFRNNTMLLQTFDNGCFPRFACLEIKKPTTSGSVLEYRLGNRVGWPIKNWDNLKSNVCHDRRFKPNTKDKLRLGKQIDEKPAKMLIDTESHSHESCELDKWTGFRDAQFVTRDDRDCDACIVYNADQPNTMIRVPLNCTSKKHHIKKYTTYRCLAAFMLEGDTHAIITRTHHIHGEFLCWIFVTPETESAEYQGIIYVTEATNCNEVAINAVKNGYVNSLHQYSIPKSPARRCPFVDVPRSSSTTERTNTDRIPPYPRPVYNTSQPSGKSDLIKGRGTSLHYNVLVQSFSVLIILIFILP